MAKLTFSRATALVLLLVAGFMHFAFVSAQEQVRCMWSWKRDVRFIQSLDSLVISNCVLSSHSTKIDSQILSVSLCFVKDVPKIVDGGVSVTEDDDVDHSVHILFCASWGSKRNFVQVRDFLEHNFPELQGKVTGDNYPVPPLIELLLKVMSFVQLAGIVLAILGGNAFRLIGMQQPPVFYTNVVQKNAMPMWVQQHPFCSFVNGSIF